MATLVGMYPTMKQAITDRSVVSRKEGQISSAVGDRIVILNLEDGAYYGLNTVGVLVWDLIEEPVLVETIYRQIMEEYDVDSGQCLADLVALLQEMQAKKLLEIDYHETSV
jgi:hypothetical protein